MDVQEAIAKLKQFRQELHDAFDHRADALMELLDALSSTPDVRSVVELSLSPFFRRGYGSVCDAIAHFFQANNPETAVEEQQTWEQKIQRLKVAYLSPPQHREILADRDRRRLDSTALCSDAGRPYLCVPAQCPWWEQAHHDRAPVLRASRVP